TGRRAQPVPCTIRPGTIMRAARFPAQGRRTRRRGRTLEQCMLRILAVLTAFCVSPALAQAVVEAPNIPRDHFDRINAFVGSSSELSGATQIRGLRPVKVNNALYYCGEVN